MTRGAHPTRAELRRGVYLILTLSYAGRLFRFAHRRVEISRDDGSYLHVDGQLLDVDFVEEVSILADVPPERSLPFRAKLPAALSSWIQRGEALDGMTGEVAVWAAGRTWEDRYVLMEGAALEPEWDPESGEVEATISDDPIEVEHRYPPEDAVIGPHTWADPQASDIGVPYPIPLGRPGYYIPEGGGFAIRPGSRAYLVDTAGTFSVPYALLISDGQAALNDVAVCGSDNTLYASSVTPVYAQDLRGRTVTVAELTSTQAGSPGFDREFFVRPISGQEGHGIYGDTLAYNSAGARVPMSGAGDILLWALRRCGRPVDYGAIEAVRSRLNRYTLAGAIEDAPDLYQWALDNLASILPLSLSVGPRGLRVDVFDPDEWIRSPAFHFRVGLDGDRDGPPTYRRNEVANTITLRWALDRGRNTYGRVLTTTPSYSNAEREVPNGLTARSIAQYGRELREDLESDLIYDLPTAQACLLARVRAKALGYRPPVYLCRPEWLAYTVGTPGLLTDQELGVSAAPVLLRAKTWGLSQARLEFILYDQT